MKCVYDWIVSFWEGADWWARLPAWGGFVLAAWNVWRGRTSLRLALTDDARMTVANISAHAVEVNDIGLVHGDGRLSKAWAPEPMTQPQLPCKIEPRSEVRFQLGIAHTLALSSEQQMHGRCGCYVRLAGWRFFSNPRCIGRKWWWLRSWLGQLSKKAKG